MTSTERQILIETVAQFQEIQKRNPVDSLPWLQASKEINAIAKRLAADTQEG